MKIFQKNVNENLVKTNHNKDCKCVVCLIKKRFNINEVYACYKEYYNNDYKK